MPNYRSFMVSPLEAVWAPPADGYLIAWYKFNEGAGNTAYNSATAGTLGGGLLPDLAVLNGRGDFWTASAGFGAVNERGTVTPLTYAYFNQGASGWGTFSGASGCAVSGFFRVYAGLSWKSLFRADAWDMYNTSAALCHNTQIYSNSDDTPMNFGIYTANVSAVTGTSPVVVSTWYMTFNASNGYMYLIKADGTATTVALGGSYTANTLQSLYVGSGTSYSFGGSFGDIMVYNNYIPTIGDWRKIYDHLRSRYSMSSRSGW